MYPVRFFSLNEKSLTTQFQWGLLPPANRKQLLYLLTGIIEKKMCYAFMKIERGGKNDDE
jgi:hypothetical protein